MDPILLQLLIFGLIAAAANVLGGLTLFPASLHRKYKQYLKHLLAIGAGFMLSVTIIEILPKSIELWDKHNDGGGHAHGAEQYFIPMMLLLGGYLLTQVVEHTIAPHFHLGEEMHCEDDDHEHAMISPRTAYTAVAGLLVHTFFDGVTIAAAAMIDAKVGLLVFVAVLLHKFPEGFTVGSMVMAAGKSRTQVLTVTALMGMMTFLGVVLYYFAGTSLGISTAYALPIAGGVTLYVAASDLIPEVNHHGGNTVWTTTSLLVGVGMFFAAHFVLHEILAH